MLDGGRTSKLVNQVDSEPVVKEPPMKYGSAEDGLQLYAGWFSEETLRLTVTCR